MKVSIMQPYFFPYIGYWQLLNATDVFVIYDDVNYIKQGYINRNSILIDGNSKRITLEVIGASSNKLINEVQVGNNTKKLLKGIEQAYKKSPEYEDSYTVIKSILEYPEKNIAKFIGHSLQSIADFLSIDTTVIYSSELEKNNNLRGQEKVIDICRHLKASEYINAIGGKELYDKETFLKSGIELRFLETGIINYKQFNNNFVPTLSIIDIMMFNTKNDIKKILNNYKLA